MGLVITLNAIDTENSLAITARATLSTSRTSRKALEDDLDADIREINTNGLGTIAAGFLDNVGAGQTQDFSWTGGVGNRRNMTFTYDKDSDTLSGIIYTKAVKDKNTGEL